MSGRAVFHSRCADVCFEQTMGVCHSCVLQSKIQVEELHFVGNNRQLRNDMAHSQTIQMSIIFYIAFVIRAVQSSSTWSLVGNEIIRDFAAIHWSNRPDAFGSAVAMNGNGSVVAIGAPNAGNDYTTPSTWIGRVSIFKYSDTDWIETGGASGSYMCDRYGKPEGISLNKEGDIIAIAGSVLMSKFHQYFACCFCFVLCCSLHVYLLKVNVGPIIGVMEVISPCSGGTGQNGIRLIHHLTIPHGTVATSVYL